MEIKNELIWSTSRISLFYECPRKYYYNYYGYWEGWLPRANEDQKELYLLKNLKNIQTLTGELVHDLISSYLKSIKNGSSELDIKDIFEKKFDHLINISTKKLYRRRPKLGGIIEHEYDIDLPQELIDEQREKGKKCLDMFLKSKHLKKILSIPSKQWIFSPNFCKCEIGAFEAYTLFDFAYEDFAEAGTPAHLVAVINDIGLLLTEASANYTSMNYLNCISNSKTALEKIDLFYLLLDDPDATNTPTETSISASIILIAMTISSVFFVFKRKRK